jgi:malate/lactate dehydrogenase
MEGVIMEVRDGNYSLLESVNLSFTQVASFTDPSKAFENADVVIFLGGFPRKPGM